MFCAIAALVLVAVFGADAPLGPRVRSSHPYIRAMIAEAQVRSATFRRLVRAVEATDGIVYVEEGDCHHKLRACLPPIVTSAGDVRFLRVLVDARQEDWQVMSDIGHELQHALEVLRDPHARTDTNLFYLWVRASFDTTDIRETSDAVRAGDAVKSEVKAFASSSSTKGLPRTAP
jgi:hypothetical protein